MKFKYIFLLLVAFGCESIVDVRVNEQPSYLVVDAWLTHEPGNQLIKLTRTQTYYDNSFADGVSGALVTVTDSEGEEFEFTEGNAGEYLWTSADTFGVIGRTYSLEIIWEGHTYNASSTLNRGADIDSIRFTYEPASGFGPEYYFAEFFGVDPEGEGDAFWLKAWRNGKYLNAPDEIYPFFDASFSRGNGDGIPFIFPIRTFPNPFESDINLNQIPPYSLEDTYSISSNNTVKIFDSEVTVSGDELSIKLSRDEPFAGGVSSYPLDGEPFFRIDENTIGKKADSLYLELHAITPEAWNFIVRMQQEINRPEGFGALFATPPANVPTNITTDSEDIAVAGFFSIARVASKGARLSEATIMPEEDL